MMHFSKTVFSMAVAVLLTGAFASSAQAQITSTPKCADVISNPGIVACTCTCDGSAFTECKGQATGTLVPTPNQCPDINQGRRVLSRGDSIVVVDPHKHSSTDENVHVLVYKAENDSDNSGLGIIDGTPAVAGLTQVPCSGHSGQPFPQQSRFARLFDLPYDMVVTLRPTTNKDDVTSTCSLASGAQTNFVLDVIGAENGAPTVPELALFHSPQWTQLAIGDFNYDGFDDIFFINRTSITIYTAVDTSDPTKGLRAESSTTTTLPSGAYQAPINEPTTGDFNGDGLVDVAWIGGDFPHQTGILSVFFATVCPAKVPGTVCADAEAFEVILDPASKLFAGATSTIVLDDAPLTPSNCGVVQSPQAAEYIVSGGSKPIQHGVLRAGAIALGNFEDNGLTPQGSPVDELVVTYIAGTNPCPANVQYWKYTVPFNNGLAGANDSSWAVQQGDTLENLLPSATQRHTVGGIQYAPVFSLYAQAAYLDWYGSTEQAVIAINGMELEPQGEYAGFTVLAGISIAGAGDQAQAQDCSIGIHEGDYPPFVWGLTVGRFSTSTTVNPDNPQACSDFPDAAPGDCPYNPQIGLLVAKDSLTFDGDGSTRIRLYTAQLSQPGTSSSQECQNNNSLVGFLPKAFKSTVPGDFQSMDVNSLRGGSRLQAGDAFGNSVRVGTPTVAHVSPHTQIQAVIQVPPSLIDYVQPNSADSSTPAIVNFTRAPNNYFAQVEFETSSMDTASTQNRYSHTNSYTESVATEVKFPNALVGTVDIKNKESWQQYSDNTHNEELGTYSTSRLQTGGSIGADDQVWWTQDSNNVYYFPVIGQTTCPTTLTCDPTDPNTTDCTAAASKVDLACAVSGDGCQCLTAGASTSLCPAIPSDAQTRSCAEQSNDVCCSLLQPPLIVNYSGAQQVARSSAPGAALEWYQPKHEPAQILSYASSRGLIENRQAGLQELAGLNAFTTGTNNTFETISWTCGTNSSVSSGTTTQNSFESDTSITLGMNNIVTMKTGTNVTGGFDYQTSTSNSTLNTATVGQTTSSSIMLNLQGAGFFNVDQYAYSVEGAVLGTEKPVSALDNPDLKVCPSDNADCDTVDQVQADCTTTGPLTVAFAADPTADGSGLWWSSTAPYLKNIDVALNNASRWRRVSASQVADPALQCRGPANVLVCYTSNQPAGTTAAEVWDTLFYNMKGLIVTTGASTGPQRDTAAVGNEVFVQVRVYNYSLKTMAAGTKVFARIYRQQLDVNNNNDNISVLDYASDANGKPLPAVPIGPTGLGDNDPIPVVSPLDGSATISAFNTTTNPANDNISIATTSYTAEAGDECEYDNGVQSCNGAYYSYWVTVWAEDASGKLLSETAGHGLATSGSGAFKPATSYSFITKVPLEKVKFGGNSSSFSNNVGMFKKAFTILPQDSTDPMPGEEALALTIDRLDASPSNALLGYPVVVSGQVTSWGGVTRGATVEFSEGDPSLGGSVFDGEWLPYIRTDDAHFVRVNYLPEACGTHEIFVAATGGAQVLGDRQSVLVDVGIDHNTALDHMIDQVMRLELNFPGKASRAHRNNLVRELNKAKSAFNAKRTNKGVFRLEKFNDTIESLKQKGRIDPEEADFLIAESEEIIGCV